MLHYALLELLPLILFKFQLSLSLAWFSILLHLFTKDIAECDYIRLYAFIDFIKFELYEKNIFLLFLLFGIIHSWLQFGGFVVWFGGGGAFC